MKTRLLGTLTAVVAVAALIFTLVPGCEDDPSMDDVDRYFAERPYITDPRGETFEGGLSISPESANPEFVGQQIVFTASGGESPYDWGVANANGTIAHNNSRDRATATYTVVTAGGDNSVIVSDEDGRAAIAEIGAAAAAALQIVPSSVTIDKDDASYTFNTVGGVTPFTWAVNNTILGTIPANDGVYVPNAVVGTNQISLVDNAGTATTATLIQIN